MGFSCGIAGLPNVGKSTIFNAGSTSKTRLISVAHARLRVAALGFGSVASLRLLKRSTPCLFEAKGWRSPCPVPPGFTDE